VTQKEVRQVETETMEIRELENGKYLLEGYVAKFGVRSKFMGFFEEIQRGAFDRTLSDGHNIFSMYSHDKSKILGSTKSGSLKLEIDNIGLRFALEIDPEISYAKDTYLLVKNRDVEGCSFGFICKEDEWKLGEDDAEVRLLKDVDLIECTITAFPAYSQTEVSCRSYDEFKEEQKNEKQRIENKRRVLYLKTLL
jgi:uncharacterized protein